MKCYMQTTILEPDRSQEPSEANSQKPSEANSQKPSETEAKSQEPSEAKAKHQKPSAHANGDFGFKTQQTACKSEILASKCSELQGKLPQAE